MQVRFYTFIENALMKRMLLAFTTLSMLLLSSCDKDDDDENEEPSLTKESLAGNYKLTAIKGKTATISERDVIDFVLEPCEKDDIINLKTDFTFDYKDEGTECNPPGDRMGIWELPGNNKITIEGRELTVTKWDGKELHGTTTETIEVVPGVEQEATLTFQFTKQ